MASMFSRVFTGLPLNQRQSSEPRTGVPMLNVLSNSLGDYFSAYGSSKRKQKLMAWFKSIPELTALTSKVAKDIISNYHFENIQPSQSGRNKLLKANRFAMEQHLTSLMLSQVIDIIVSGEGYGWKGKLDETQIKEAIDKALKFDLHLEKKEKSKLAKELELELKHLPLETVEDTSKFNDEDNYLLKKYRYIASSTMENIYDEYTIKGYKQWVGVRDEFFNTDEIIRFTFMEVDGKPFGFTPVEAILVQLELLRMMWQNQVAIHKNGGSPDKIVVAKDISPQSPAYKNILEQLQKYKMVENKHGNMLFTGNIDVLDLQQLDKMQFMDQGLYITGLIAMQWQIPRSSIPYILGSANTKDDTGGNSEKGYWDNIKLCQRLYAETMNAYLWMPYFGVKIVFDSVYLQQDIQKGQATMQNFNNVLSLSKILQSSGKQLKTETILKMTNLNDEDIEEFKMDPIMQQNMDMQKESQAAKGMENQPSSESLKKGLGAENHSNAKRAEQSAVQNSRGKVTGFGKELGNDWDYDSFMEYKTLGKKEIQEIDFLNFIKIYTEDKNYQQGQPPRIFLKDAMGNYELTFASTDFVYRTLIGPEDVTGTDFMNLQGANIYRI